MSDQPKKQELPPLDESIVKSVDELSRHLRVQIADIVAVRFMVANNVLCGLDERERQLLAALSDNEALRAKLKSVEGIARRTKLKKVAIDHDGGEYVPSKGQDGLYYNADPVDALLARIREAMKGDK